jgi:hypothetical protein
MVSRAEDWPWSSYRATTGGAACPDWLRRDWLLSAFGATEQAAVASYRRVAKRTGSREKDGVWSKPSDKGVANA